MSDRAVRLTEGRGQVTATLDHGANALDEELIAQLREALAWLRDQGPPPLILESDHPTLFCPGWDLKQLADADRKRIERFLQLFEGLVLDLFSYPAPTVAAVGGSAVAGGCLLALACDQRTMVTGRTRIGLSELNLGVPVPFGSIQMLRARLGRRGFDELVFRGEGLSAERAVDLGVVHRACGFSELGPTAHRLLDAMAGAAPAAYAATKRFAFGGAWAAMETGSADATEAFLDAWFDPATHDRIATVAARLGR